MMRKVHSPKTALAISAALGLALSGAQVVASPPADATPGDQNFRLTYTPTSTNRGDFRVYNGGVNGPTSAQYGSSSGGTQNQSSCNKYLGSTDADGGGRLPAGWYHTPGTHNGVTTWFTWSDSYNLGGSVGNSAALALADKQCTNGTLRDGLYVHRQGSTWTSNGCIKLTDAHLNGPTEPTLNGWFHGKAGGTNTGDYTNVLYAFA